MDDEFTINVTIAERRYPIRIKRKDEETVRNAAKRINDRVLLYRKNYKGTDSQDFMAMATLQFVIEYFELVEKNDIDPAIAQIENINDHLKNYLDKS
ncbi:MAG: cell division protein ZapA [Prolixibacteraceae bacterium]|jgi:cell division protein ZapA (FtsZ GTPase activity inhibitor)|nr:cell division protein ZapA [Prolixibacteraceae bacterium]